MQSPGGCNSRRDIPALAFCELTKTSKLPLPARYPKELKSFADHLRKRRYDLKLSQHQVAKIIGVSIDTITYWENDRSQPTLMNMPKIVSFLGYSPLNFEVKTLGDQIKYLRILKGLSQKKLAELLDVDPSTLATWEQNKGRLDKKKLMILLKQKS
jgi:transcriptional regulator with XRE-family HTH domain